MNNIPAQGLYSCQDWKGDSPIADPSVGASENEKNGKLK